MFIDLDARGGGGPHYHTCKSCNLLIEPGQRMEEVWFEADDNELDQLNGSYHSACASPILSVKRAYDALRRFGAGF